MRIAVGICESDTGKDIESMVAAGANEFYCGVVLEAWADEFGYAISPNRRQERSYQFTDREALRQAIEAAHGVGARVYVTFNEHEYCTAQMPVLLDHISVAVESDCDGIIIASMPLLIAIRKMNLPCEIHLSGDAGVRNCEALAAFLDIGIDRLIFPRLMTREEIQSIVKRFGDSKLQYEVFMLGQRCRWSSEVCLSEHGFAGSPFCGGKYERMLCRTWPTSWLAERECVDETTLIDKYRTIQWDAITAWEHNVAECRLRNRELLSAESLRAIELKHCGLCSLEFFRNIGIHAFKIVSRGESLDWKLSKIQLLAGLLNQSTITIENCQAARGTPTLCASGYYCYYRGREDI